MTTNTTNPVRTSRDGAIKATICRNAGDKGEFHSVRFTRTWKDDQGKFHDADGFSGSDLLRVARLAAKAYDELAALRVASAAPGEPAE